MPMIGEALGVLLCLLVLTIIGIGPALWVVSPAHHRVARALGMAPALGFAIIGLVAFPLARHLAPVRSWAWALASFLALSSLVLLWRDWRRHRSAYPSASHPRVLLPTVILLLLCYLILVSPLILNGPQHAVFRSNPSDAFLYISLAETLRVVDWATLLQGASLTKDNFEGLHRLAHTSPTALFTARMLLLPLALNNPAALAWTAETAGVPVHRFYFPYHLLAFSLALPISLVIGDLLQLRAHLRYLAAAAVSLGFWAQFVLESDAGYQITSIPLLLLVVFAWIQLEAERPHLISRSRLLLAFTCATLAAFYSPLLSLLIVAFALYHGLGLWQRVSRLSAVAYHGVTLILIASILTLSGQIDYLFRNAGYLIGSVQRLYSEDVVRLIRNDGVAAVWGLPPSILLGHSAAITSSALRTIATAVGMLLTAALVVTAVLAARRSASSAERIVFALLASGVLLALVNLLSGNHRNAGRAFTYVYPYLILGVLALTNHSKRLFKPWVRRGVLALLTVWLLAQCLLALYLPYTETLGALFRGVENSKPESYDLAPIVEYLERHPPTLLLVNVPRTKTWTFAYYSMLVFSRYPSHFQSGLVIDNNTRFRSLWFDDLGRVPDYAVMLKSVDYVGPEKLGIRVAETADLALYRITTQDLAVFNEQERSFREVEQDKPAFPTWERSIAHTGRMSSGGAMPRRNGRSTPWTHGRDCGFIMGSGAVTSVCAARAP